MQPVNVSTLDGIIDAFYDIVSIPKGHQRRWDDDKFIHSKNPKILIPNGKNQDFTQLTIEEYHLRRDQIADQSFFEKEINRITEQFGNMAHVWSTYEWNRGSESSECGRGINSIQLYYAENRWWVSSWFFVSEDELNPIPEKYLPQR